MHGRPQGAPRLLAPSLLVLALLASAGLVRAQVPAVVPVEGQPLAANVERVVRALEFLGAPLPEEMAAALAEAGAARDAAALQERLGPHVLLFVTINPEERVKVGRGPAPVVLQQGGYTPVLVEVLNEAATTRTLRITSPRSGPVTAGAADLSLRRQDQTDLKDGEVPGGAPGGAVRPAGGDHRLLDDAGSECHLLPHPAS